MLTRKKQNSDREQPLHKHRKNSLGNTLSTRTRHGPLKHHPVRAVQLRFQVNSGRQVVAPEYEIRVALRNTSRKKKKNRSHYLVFLQKLRRPENSV